jgi:hypothetical protein
MQCHKATLAALATSMQCAELQTCLLNEGPRLQVQAQSTSIPFVALSVVRSSVYQRKEECHACLVMPSTWGHPTVNVGWYQEPLVHSS